MEDTTGLGMTTELTADGLRHPSRDAAGRQLELEYSKLFPGPDSTSHYNNIGWQMAAVNGATLRWARCAAGQVEGLILPTTALRVRWALLLAAAVPVDLIDGLLGDGWTLTELASLLYNLPDDGFPETARRLSALHQAVPGTGGLDGELLSRALAAVLSAGPAGLTDLQALRWLQQLAPSMKGIPRVELAISLVEEAATASALREWAAAAGPDGWAWLMAGYTPAETRVVLALPVGHPDRPGPDQLAVMAALRET